MQLPKLLLPLPSLLILPEASALSPPLLVQLSFFCSCAGSSYSRSLWLRLLLLLLLVIFLLVHVLPYVDRKTLKEISWSLGAWWVLVGCSHLKPAMRCHRVVDIWKFYCLARADVFGFRALSTKADQHSVFDASCFTFWATGLDGSFGRWWSDGRLWTVESMHPDPEPLLSTIC